jgi:hypothetical protein
VIFITVHSGIGGEAESFRQAVEGLGWNQALFPLARAQKNLRRLAGSTVSITQGAVSLPGFELAAAGRVPAEGLARYFSLPAASALELAAQFAPVLQPFVNPDQPQVVFETCGWKMPEEPWAPEVTSASGSVYLGVIRKQP